jgi:DNA-binding NtrC family response regulator
VISPLPPPYPALTGRTVLIVDDSESVRTALSLLLRLRGATTLCAAAPAEALTLIENHVVDVVIQDMNFGRGEMGGHEGIGLFRAIHSRYESIPIILLTAFTHLESAVALVKDGAADYVSKPWDEPRLLTTLRNLVELRIARAEAHSVRRSRMAAREELAEQFDLQNLIYESESIHTLLAVATRIANADVPVLITGPSGAGKEAIADIIQINSAVAGGPYCKVNFGAMPTELIEAELFGTESGAFTGARRRAGLFEAANNGTLFMDEIGNLPAAGQAKLLRVLQTGEFLPLGSNLPRHVKVRIIAATNISLRDAIRQQRFREDLYYRLNVIELDLPPLADRVDDIIPLALSFLDRGFSLTADAQCALRKYTWPGNVRELQNVIRRVCLLSSGTELNAACLSLPANETRHESELDRAAIEQALQNVRGVVAHAARDLGLTRQALYRRMDRLRLRAAVGTTRNRVER